MLASVAAGSLIVFGRKLKRGDYVELDLIQPSAIGDSDAWKEQPWYGSFHPELQAHKAVLMTVKPKSYVLFLAPR